MLLRLDCAMEKSVAQSNQVQATLYYILYDITSLNLHCATFYIFIIISLNTDVNPSPYRECLNFEIRISNQLFKIQNYKFKILL